MKFLVNPKLPLKYQLECHTSLPKYPQKEDFMYDVTSYIVKVFEIKPKAWDPTDIKFSTKTLKYVFGDKYSPELIEKLKPILRSLVEDGTLTRKGDFLHIRESDFLTYFSLII